MTGRPCLVEHGGGTPDITEGDDPMARDQHTGGGHHEVEYRGLSGRFKAWLLGSWPRRLKEWLKGNPRPRFYEILGLEGDEVVLDAGCGSGFYSLDVAKRLSTGKVICVDVSETMLASLRRGARKRGLDGRLEVHLGACENLPIADAAADIGFSVVVWHHLDEPPAAGRELFRVIKPGGRAVVIEFNESAEKSRQRHHDHAPAGNPGGHELGGPGVERILGDAGFVDVQAEVIRGWVLVHGVKPG